ncbi:MAG TPA: aminotransferase class I/II-fold pyridoxal phosphate-dependent enzyme [Drouetiella sp.]
MSKKGDKRHKDYAIRTCMIHNDYDSRHWEYNHPIVPPMNASCAYRLDSVQRGAQGFAQFASDECEAEVPIYVYERLDEPTRGILEEKLALAEDGDVAVCFATGMAAVSAALSISSKCGDEIIAHQLLYGCTFSLLNNWMLRQGVATQFIDLRDVAMLANSITEKTRVVYFETPMNPTLELLDIKAIRECVDAANLHRRDEDKIVVIVDNTFATPFCQRPLNHGADLVVHSLTKHIGGFGTDMGGVVVGRMRFHKPLLLYRKDFGGSLSARSAWPLLVYGLPTLATRLEHEQNSAIKVAQFLESHPMVERVSYPSLQSFSQRELARRQMVNYDGDFAPGSMIYFVLKGDVEAAQRAAAHFIDAIASSAQSVTLAVSLGQTRTLIEEPYTMTHSTLPDAIKNTASLEPGGIRLSIGLEDVKDIISDLTRALKITSSKLSNKSALAKR